jgi:acyl dehydratase
MRAASPASIADLERLVAHALGTSHWYDVTQLAADAFADLTGDHLGIQTDPARARASPCGGTIPHGYYMLALAPILLDEVLPLGHFPAILNYGLDRLRFPAPLPVGSRVRMHALMNRVDRFPGGAQLALTLTFERENSPKPVCVAEALIRVFEENSGA